MNQQKCECLHTIENCTSKVEWADIINCIETEHYYVLETGEIFGQLILIDKATGETREISDAVLGMPPIFELGYLPDTIVSSRYADISNVNVNIQTETFFLDLASGKSTVISCTESFVSNLEYAKDGYIIYTDHTRAPSSLYVYDAKTAGTIKINAPVGFQGFTSAFDVDKDILYCIATKHQAQQSAQEEFLLMEVDLQNSGSIINQLQIVYPAHFWLAGLYKRNHALICLGASEFNDYRHNDDSVIIKEIDLSTGTYKVIFSRCIRHAFRSYFSLVHIKEKAWACFGFYPDRRSHNIAGICGINLDTLEYRIFLNDNAVMPFYCVGNSLYFRSQQGKNYRLNLSGSPIKEEIN